MTVGFQGLARRGVSESCRGSSQRAEGGKSPALLCVGDGAMSWLRCSPYVSETLGVCINCIKTPGVFWVLFLFLFPTPEAPAALKVNWIFLSNARRSDNSASV